MFEKFHNKKVGSCQYTHTNPDLDLYCVLLPENEWDGAKDIIKMKTNIIGIVKDTTDFNNIIAEMDIISLARTMMRNSSEYKKGVKKFIIYSTILEFIKQPNYDQKNYEQELEKIQKLIKEFDEDANDRAFYIYFDDIDFVKMVFQYAIQIMSRRLADLPGK